MDVNHIHRGWINNARFVLAAQRPVRNSAARKAALYIGQCPYRANLLGREPDQIDKTTENAKPKEGIMQITINTADILGDESSIRDEVIEQIADALKIEIRRSADKIIKEELEKALVVTIKERVASIVDMHLDTEYTETDEYGRCGKSSTVRNRIAEGLSRQCTFKKANYSSDQNAFTRAVMDTVEQEMKKFRAEYTSLVNKMLIQQCMEEAAAKLRAACGIK